ncbi:MAG: hypothetical protein L0K39_13145, partial [Enterobacterales bacterium]|nr:hypothetical protein [Enterobacterales bacterium]MDN6774875.1 hypothetical protein [Enterobacterales bacterium]
ADGSVGSPHARVGNCQALIKVKNLSRKTGVFCYGEFEHLIQYITANAAISRPISQKTLQVTDDFFIG